jgi:pimeloyl-ACP methyl ester carboxylesterase
MFPFQSDLPLSDLIQRWAPEPSRFLDLEGMRVHYRDEGPRDDPCPVVLVHGTAASLHTWEGWVDALKAERRVITMDIPGFGLTGPDPKDDYHIDRYTRFILALLDALGVTGTFIIGGNSLGGEIAWHVAAKVPERVRAAVLVDAAGFYPLPVAFPLGFWLATKPWLNWLTCRALPRQVLRSSVHFVYGDPRRVSPALEQRYFELALRPGNRRALAQRLQQHTMGQDNDQLKRLTMPVMLVWGAKDQLFDLNHARALQAAIPRSQLVTFPGLGHVPHEEDPKITVAAVQAFLSRL